MRTKQLICAGLVALMVPGACLRAQSLAEVAKAEEARRKTVKSPAKIYTNDDLKGGGSASGAPAPPAAAAPSTAKPETPAAVPDAKKDPKQEEKYWRDRMAALRNQVARNKVLLEALQSRVNALTTDFANRDDPAQRAIIEEDRKRALAEMDRVSKDTDATNKAIFDLAEEARKANVPPGWLR